MKLGRLQCHSLRWEALEKEFVGSGDTELEMTEMCTKINVK